MKLNDSLMDMIKVGDIVELQPTNQRNRQLRSQDKKHIWEVVKIDTPQCFNGTVGFLILHQSGNSLKCENCHTQEFKILPFQIEKKYI